MYEMLSQLLRNDREKVRHMLGVFERVTRCDIERMDAAFTQGDRDAIRALAHRMKSACLQIGEQAAGHLLASLENLADGPHTSFEQGFQAAREELDRVLIRVDSYLASPPDTGLR